MSLLPISRLIANSALRLGGSKILWFKAQHCNGQRPSGAPCFDEEQGDNWLDCPICHGQGMSYPRKPRVVLGIYTDNSNQFEPDGNGGFLQGKKTLSLPYDLDIRMLKPRYNSHDGLPGNREVLRDKFVILSPDNRPVETVYMDADPVKPTINSGSIYQYVTVAGNS